jgi:hypothetical protein
MSDADLRKHLLELLDGGQAHIRFEDAVKGFPVDKAGTRPKGSPHSAWELLEHIRIATEDIARFSGVMDDANRLRTSRENPKGYVVLKWPDDYWPKSPGPGDPKQWSKSVTAVRKEIKGFARLIEDPHRDLSEPFPWGDGQSLLREALLIADHNSYHIGQLVLVRRMIE